LCIVPRAYTSSGWCYAPGFSNGLGLSTADAEAQLNRIKGMFSCYRTRRHLSGLEALVTKYQVCGKPAHDARLVAAMQVHGLTAILTFDKTGFSAIQISKSSTLRHGSRRTHRDRT